MIQASTLLNVIGQCQTWNSECTRAFKVKTDSRKVKDGDIFFALRGERFDAFNFIKDVVDAHPAAIVFEGAEGRDEQLKTLVKNNPDIFFIQTSSSLDILQKLARQHRENWSQGKKEVLGLTGSNGKTTAKEILRALIGKIIGNALHCTEGNLNNHIGVPLTLLELEDHHELAIVEMGTNHAGEIADLCNIALPTCGFITNIGTAHIEHFKSPQNIFKEKRSLYESIMTSTQKSHFVLNEDDEFLKKLPIVEGVKTFGRNSEDFRVECDYDKLTIEFGEEEREIKNTNLCGKHVYQNLGLALSLSILLFPKHKEELLEKAEEITLPSNNRGEWQIVGDTSLFLDAYNANPNSMRASLETFAYQQNKLGIDQKERLYILGDMNELGDLSLDFHRESGEFLRDLGAVNVYFIGHYAHAYAEGFGGGNVFLHREEAEDYYKNQKAKFKSVFLKASRSLQLESMTAIF
jgi:UDP-N-acetylmuramoyl-tripeptide--D-alanyl-D-alanine ligase